MAVVSFPSQSLRFTSTRLEFFDEFGNLGVAVDTAARMYDHSVTEYCRVTSLDGQTGINTIVAGIVMKTERIRSEETITTNMPVARVARIGLMVDNGHAPLIAVRNRPRVVHPFGRFPPGFFLPLPFVNEIVRIFDTTLRDGEQSPGFSMRVGEKLELARQLDSLGVDFIEAGFPIASAADAEAVRLVANEVKRPSIACLARCRRGDIERAGWAIKPAVRPRIHTFIATSDLHLSAKLRITRQACLEAAVDNVRLARNYTDDVQFSAEDATRSDREFLCRVIESVIKAGASTINLPDTVGYSTPDEIYEFFKSIREQVSASDQVIFSTHCHDDLGLAVANTFAAVRAGARQVECTINGIGERAGNAALEEVVMGFHVRADRLPFSTTVNTKHI